MARNTERTVEQAYELFLKHEAVIRAAKGANEATTRLRAIDTLLFEVLGWDKRVVETEPFSRGQGFADYAFKVADVIALVLEAKKEKGPNFLIPTSKRAQAPVGFPLLSKECPDADVALRQALGYGAQYSSRYIAISNGFQWLLTLTFVHGQPVDQRSVYVFDSVDYIKDNFRFFWDCFSPEAIRTNRPANALIEVRKAPAPPKASQYIPGYPEEATRNIISDKLTDVLKIFWENVKNLEGEKAFLELCYVRPENTDTNVKFAATLVRQRLSDDEQIAVSAVDGSEIGSLIDSATGSEKPIIVLGRIGHGKTTFLNYLRKVAAQTLFNRYIQVDVNFLDRPESADDVPRYIFDEVERQLRENYDIDIKKDSVVRGALHKELDRFRETPVGTKYKNTSEKFKQAELEFIKEQQADRHQYLQKVLNHLRYGQRRSIAIFLDNLDKRYDAIQEEAFLRASAMARDWACILFVCLRPGTYYRSKAFSVLDSVSPRVISITSPKARLLVPPRLKFAKTLAAGTPEAKARKRIPKELGFNLPHVANFLHCCAESFLHKRELGMLFDAVSNGNARDLLINVYEVLTSSHLNTEKILDKLRRGSYEIPDFEAMRALLYRDSIHYDPSRSPFVNLFDIERADPNEHFSRYALLLFLLSIPDRHPTYGYASLDDITSYFCSLGFSEEHTLTTMKVMFDKRYCDTKMGVEEWSDDVTNLKISNKGKFHFTNLVNQFQYMDAVTIDTPILEEAVRSQIRDDRDISLRIARCEVFLSYLDRQSATIQDGNFLQQWSKTVKHVRDDMRGIKGRATRSARRR